jgi:parvulin-like peptidyl-prolyl isomerase
MNFKFTIVLLTFLNGYSLCNDKDEILASVGNHLISLDQFSERYNIFLTYSGVKDNFNVRKSILHNMINEILLCNYDNNEEIINNEEYKKESKWTKNQTILAYLKDREIYADIAVSEEELRDAFVKLNEKLAARHLYTETEEEANNLYQLLAIGIDFNYLAKQVFSDSVLRNNGGYLGYFSWDDMDPAFEEAAYSMRVGDISKPVKTAQGYSIIMLEDRISNPLLTENEFLNKKQQLTRLLKIRKKKPAETEYLSKLIDLDKISFNDKVLVDILSELSETADLKTGEEYNVPDLRAICAEYNKEFFNAADIYRWIDILPSNYKTRIKNIQNLKDAIKGFLLQEKLLKVSEEKNYDKNPEVLEMLSKTDKNLFLKYKKKLITDGFKVMEQEALDFYNKNLDLFTSERELNIQEIIIDNSDLAGEIMRKLIVGEDFGGLVRKHSLRKWSAENDGEIGFAPLSRYGMLKDTLWNSRIGEIIGPFDIKGYFGIFKILGKNEVKPVPFNEMKEKVVSAYKLERQSQIMNNYIQSIQNKVRVEINDQLLKTFSISS